MSERTFRRWRDRFEAEGAEGLYDQRLGQVSARRAPVDEVALVRPRDPTHAANPNRVLQQPRLALFSVMC